MGKALYNRFRPVKSGAAGFYLDLPTVQHLYLLVDLMDEKAEMTCTSLEDPGFSRCWLLRSGPVRCARRTPPGHQLAPPGVSSAPSKLPGWATHFLHLGGASGASVEPAAEVEASGASLSGAVLARLRAERERRR